MRNKIKLMIAKSATSVAVLLMLSSFSAAQQAVVGSVAFLPTGTTHNMQSISSIGFANHSISCAQIPVWADADIQKGNNPAIDNRTHFGPCAIDGVRVGNLVLAEINTGISLTIHLVDGTCLSMMLANSDGLRLSDLTEV